MITRKDIAQKLGVSVSVVSRALNNSGYVDKKKKEQIIRLAKEMGYTKEPVALSNGGGSHHQLLFYTRDLYNPFYHEVYEGILDSAMANGFSAMFYYASDYDMIPRISTDGIIFSSEQLANNYLNDIGHNYFLPAVTCSYGYDYLFPRSLPMVDCDLTVGTRMVIDYLYQRGHQKIAMVSPDDFNSFTIRSNIWKTYMQQITGDHVIDYYFNLQEDVPFHKESKVLNKVQDNVKKGIIGGKRFIESGCDATAVICFNDEVSIGFYIAVTEMGLHIPDDVSLIGFDYSYMIRRFSRRITTLNMNPFEQGRQAASLLIEVIKGRPYERKLSIPLQIIEGDTVGAPKIV